MHSYTYRIPVAVLALVLAGTMMSVAQSTVPDSDTFEAYSDGDALAAPWDTTDSSVVATGTVVTSEGYDAGPYAGSLSAYAPQDTGMTNEFDGTDTRVWLDLYTIPKLWSGDIDERTVDSSAAALFFFSSNGYPVVHETFSGTTTWVENATVTGLTGNWARVTVFMDADVGEWALFMNRAEAAEAELVGQELGFVNTGVTAFNSFSAQDDVFIDNFEVVESYADLAKAIWADSDGDDLNDAFEIHYFGNTTSTESYYTDSDGDGRIDGYEMEEGTNPYNILDRAYAVPYYQDFESYSAGALAAGQGLTPSSSRVEVYADTFSGTKALQICATSGVSLALSGNKGTNVWAVMYMKPVPIDQVPGADQLGDEDVAGFCVFTNGNLYAFDETDWVDTTFSVPTNQWLGFALHLDYNLSMYDLYVDTNGVVNGIMERVNSTPYDFNTGATAAMPYFTGMTITNSSAYCMYLDELAVTVSGITNINEAADYERFAPGDRHAEEEYVLEIPFDYANGENTLAGQAGADIGNGVQEGDVLWVFNTNGWNSYTWENNAWTPGSGSDPLAQIQIFTYTPLIIDRTGNVTDDIGDVPFSTNDTVAVTPVAYGTNTEARGWNFFLRQNSSTLSDFTNVTRNASGFESYGLRIGNSGVRYYWQTVPAPGGWMRSGNVDAGTVNLPAGQYYWLRRGWAGSDTFSDN